MSTIKRLSPCVFFLILAIAFFSIGTPTFSNSIANAAPAIHEKMLTNLAFIHGLISLALSFFLFIHKHRTFRAISTDSRRFRLQILQTLRNTKPTKAEWRFLIIIIFTGGVLRAYFLTQPIRVDEARTYLEYIQSEFAGLFYYSAPNNHVFHTILAYTTTSIFGNSPAALRLPSFLCGLSLIPAIFICTRMFGRNKSGLFAAGLIAILPYIIMYSSLARGYSIITLFSIILFILISLYAEKRNAISLLAISTITALGLFTIPTMLFPAGGLYIWLLYLLANSRIKFKDIITKTFLPIITLTSIVTFICYTPVLIITGDISKITSNKFVKSVTASEFFSQLPNHALDTYSRFTIDVPTFACILIFALCLYSAVQLFRNSDKKAIALPICLVTGCLLLLFAKMKIPFARTWIFLIPFLFIYADIGLSELFKKLPRTTNPTLIILTILFIFRATDTAAKGNISKYTYGGNLPSAEFFATHIAALTTDKDLIVVEGENFLCVYYYLFHQGHKHRVQRYGENPKKFILSRNPLPHPAAYKISENQHISLYYLKPQ